MIKCIFALRTINNFFNQTVEASLITKSLLTELRGTTFIKQFQFLKICSNFYLPLSMASNRYCIDTAKRGTAGCKECKKKIEKGVARIGKIIPNPFTDAGGDMKQWFHVRCAFVKLTRAKAATKKIDDTDDLEGFDDMDDEIKDEVIKYIAEFSTSSVKTPKKKQKSSDDSSPAATEKSPEKRSETPPDDSSPSTPGTQKTSGKDNLFREFRRLLADLANDSTHTGKTAAIKNIFEKGSDGKGFNGDLFLWAKMLLPSVNKRVYNLQNKQIVKLFSQIFDASQEEMIEDLEQGNVGETVRIFFEQSTECPPTKKSLLTLQEVDDYLEQLSKRSKEEEQMQLLKKVTKRCTSNDLKTFVYFIKHDLRIGAGAKPVLDAIHPSAYAAFQASRNLEDVIKRFLKQGGNANKELHVKASLMTPVLPMLAAPCKKLEKAFEKCPNGMLVEIKYDGERVQLHKRGSEFLYFSRSLKPVMPHKILHFKDFIPKAFPSANDLILDSEILLVDNDGKPLPFGTLGAHKSKDFKDATVCLFVFDCLQFNDESLLNTPLVERRKILEENMKPIKNHIIFSEMKPMKDQDELKRMIRSIVNQGLEGLMVKDKLGIYEPGKRHWLKIKKDYLTDDAMADTADLVVLGAYYGSGNKGGMMSVFLMGCLNPKTNKWCTVTKVGSGHTDSVLEKLQKQLNMVKISKDVDKVPSWLNVNKSLVPDFVTADPEKSQVWEITGAEFSKAEIHTASGLSIRFPRVTRIRTDKTPKEATTLHELQELYRVSKQTTDMIGLSSSPKHKSQKDSESESDDTDIEEERRSPSPRKGSSKAERKGSRSRSRSKTPTKKASQKTKLKKSRSRSKTPPKKPSAAKRKSSSSPSSSPPKKFTRDESARNKEFKKREDEPESVGTSDIARIGRSNLGDEDNGDKRREILEKLLDFFSGVKLFLPMTLKDFEILRRYFISYDGIILENHQKMDATHVICADSQSVEKRPRSARQITVDWLWDCIKLQKKISTRFYKPPDDSSNGVLT